MEDKKFNENEIQEMAVRLESLMKLVDMFVEYAEDKIHLLTEVEHSLMKKISHNESALPVIFALGGNYDRTEDAYKKETINNLIKLIKTRIDFRNAMIKQKENETNRINNLKMLGLF